MQTQEERAQMTTSIFAQSVSVAATVAGPAKAVILVTGVDGNALEIALTKHQVHALFKDLSDLTDDLSEL
jgi:hypothetical protein